MNCSSCETSLDTKSYLFIGRSKICLDCQTEYEYYSCQSVDCDTIFSTYDMMPEDYTCFICHDYFCKRCLRIKFNTLVCNECYID